MEELEEIDDRRFSSYKVGKKQLTPTEEDDPGDFSGGKILMYEVPKKSYFGRETEEEMYNMLIDMFGRGENNGPGRQYTKISYNIEDAGNSWNIEIKEINGYDI